jgi:hypothetical protein
MGFMFALKYTRLCEALCLCGFTELARGNHELTCHSFAHFDAIYPR